LRKKTAITGPQPTGNVKVVVLPGMKGEVVAAPERKKIERLIRDKLLRGIKVPYHKVQVEVERGPDGKPIALLASMLRALTYTADIVRIEVDAHGEAKSFERLTPAEKN
jgi:hypothetical protein